MRPAYEKAASDILNALDGLAIPHDLLEHDPAPTIEDCAPIGEALHAAVLKNLFLTTRRAGGFYLYLTLPDKAFSAGAVSAQAGTSRLCFAPEDELNRLLLTYPGAVNPLGLIFDKKNEVRLLIDRQALRIPRLAFHPCRNDRTVAMTARDFTDIFLPCARHGYTLID